MNTITLILIISIISPLVGFVLMLKFKNKFVFSPFLIPLIVFIFFIFSFTSAPCEIGCDFLDFILLVNLAIVLINFMILGIGIFLSIKIKKYGKF